MRLRSHSIVLLSVGFLGASISAAFAAPKLVQNNVTAPIPVPDRLLQGWNQPPASSKPFVYWYWLNNIVTKQGITRDLEMMARNGIGGAYIGNIGGPELDPPRNGLVRGFSDEWYDLMQFAVREGLRTGVQIGTFNGSGWSQSGGPWVKPEDSMQYIDFTEIHVAGGTLISQGLPRVNGALKDVRVLAFPAPAHEGETLKPRSLTSNQGAELSAAELSALADGLTHELPANKNYGRLTLTWEFESPQTVRSVLFRHHNGNQVGGRISYSADGTNFQPLRDFTLDRRDGPQVLLRGRPSAVSTSPTTARYFRIEMPWDTRRDGRSLGIAFSSAARLEMAEEKQMGVASRDITPAWDHFRWPATPEPGDGAISPAQVIDLTSKMSPDGRLTWQAPAGNWVVQRYSTVSTGEKSGPTSDDLTGLELDKMSHEAAKRYIDNGLVGQLYRRLTPAERKGFTYAIIDSYEKGFQNWTPKMESEFKARIGYDPTPWLPVLSGRIVGSAAQSDRFLWDVRRVVADLVAVNYVGGLRDAVHPLGLKLWLENYGHWGFPAEFGSYGGQADGLGGEFWTPTGTGGIELRVAASTAHIYGKNTVSAESFTSVGSQFESPGTLKAKGDWSYANGVNHNVLHVVSHQPTDVPGPGLELVYGTYFNRNSLWFTEHGPAWVDYLRRSNFMLQQGTATADVAYYIGEDTPVMTGKADPELPDGYDSDWINAEVLLKRAAVKNGRLTLPGGASYAILAIPASASMRLAVLEKISALVKAGLTVVGTAPTQSPSLQDYPRADAKIKALVTQLWPSRGTTKRKTGKGTVWGATSLAPVLASLKVAPAVIESNPQVLWKQRHLPDGELFFLSNQSDSSIKIVPSFRVTGLAPQLWNAETQVIENPGAYQQMGGRTRVPLDLGPLESVFVVFRGKTKAPPVVDVRRDGKAILSWTEKTVALEGEVADSNLTQSFWVKPSGPIRIPNQHLGGIELQGQRWVLTPPHGTFQRGNGFAGTGVSVGTNGIAVIQHWSDNAPAVLTWASPTPLTEWTHVTVAYRNGVPQLYVNGAPVKTGERTGQRIIAGESGGVGQTSLGSPFEGQVSGLKTGYTPLTEPEIVALAKQRDTSVSVPLGFDLKRATNGKLQLQSSLPGRYTITYSDGRTGIAQVAAPLATQTLDGPWNLSFQGAAAPAATTWDRLRSLSDSPDEGIKYFSGNTTYETTFDLPADYQANNSPCTLKLGRVELVARVLVNGQMAGTALRAPYQLEVSRFLKPGQNTLRVLVTNTWANRMIGDEQFPDDLAAIRDGSGNLTQWPDWAFKGTPRPDPRRVTLSSRRFFTKDSALPASGLIGPVRLDFERQVEISP